MKRKPINFFEKLPEELILYEILLYLTAEEVVKSIFLINKQIYRLASRNSLWKEKVRLINVVSGISLSRIELETALITHGSWLSVFCHLFIPNFDQKLSSPDLVIMYEQRRALRPRYSIRARNAAVNTLVKPPSVRSFHFLVSCSNKFVGMVMGIINHEHVLIGKDYVGGSEYGYALGLFNWYDGTHKIHKDVGTRYCEPKIESGDIITMIVDLKKYELSFEINGDEQGVAFELPKDNKAIYRPCVSFGKSSLLQIVRILPKVMKGEELRSVRNEMVKFRDEYRETINSKNLGKSKLNRSRIYKIRNLK